MLLVCTKDVPFHTSLEEVVVHRLALVVLQVGKRRSLNSDIETPTSVRAEWNPHKRHLPTVQISRNRNGGCRQFLVLNIKTRREGDTRLWRKVYTTIETDGLRHILLVARRTIVHIGYSVTYDIVEADIPRNGEVVVTARHIVPS